MKDIKSSITITASPQEVWQVLVDLEHYHEWNPMFVEAKGTIAAFSWSPKVAKLEPNASLEWSSPVSGMSGVVNGTHYFQLSCTNDGTSTEFTQGRRYEGVGSSLCSGFGSMEDARRGLTAMNKALQMETARRKSMAKPNEPPVDEKEEEIAQLDISDSTAVAAAVLSSSTMGDTTIEERNIAIEEKSSTIEEKNATIDEKNTPEALASDTTEKVPLPSTEYAIAPIARTAERLAGRTHEKRASIIGAVSSLFGSTKPSAQDRLPTSTSRIDLLSKALEEEQEDDGRDQEIEEEKRKECEIQADDPEAKNAREVKNAERIELDLGSSDIDLGDFGI
ncbi:hypothetical protein BGZ51_004633 [Haplosporangium sp. Z 767]|nr:hypothetical protein BGZ51_004633 [Haplosporangium sp. Z 767]KAF9195549.1 hypothetical protein BGZ50_004349 [Haplosporangium sp. Z 11]